MPTGGRLGTIWDALRTSFWFVPTLMAAAGGLITAACLWAEAAIGPVARVPWFVYVNGADDARQLLSTLFGSMITMATLVFSITMVVLTLAANQFGPRLVRNFMASVQTQLVLGTFVLTIVHCLLSLSSTGFRQAEGPLPYLTVTAAILLSLISVGLLVLHLHVLGRSIVSETVIARVGAELEHALDALDPLGDSRETEPQTALPGDFDQTAAFIGPGATGYVQAIEFGQLVEAAESADVVIGVTFRAGDFVVRDGGGIGIHPADRATPDLARKAAGAIVIGAHRTPVQDPDFAIRHLVEIAVRALSPGVNDPYTAVSAVNQLSASLVRLLGRELPAGVWRDGSGRIRVICPRPSYASLIASAFDQIRQNGGDKPVVVIHLIEALERIAGHVRLPEQKQALRIELDTILETATRAVPDASDRADIEERARSAAETIAQSALRQA